MSRFQSVEVKKDENVNLSKIYGENQEDEGIKKIHVGLGWQVCSDRDADLDIYALCLAKGCKEEVVYFGNLENRNKSIKHTGDNLTGSDSRNSQIKQDDESIMINFKNLTRNIDEIVIGLNIYRNTHDFTQVKDTYVRIVDLDRKEEILKYDITNETGKKSNMIICKFIKENNDWTFIAVGQLTNDTSIREFYDNYCKKTGNKSSSKQEGFFKKIFKCFKQ